MRCVPTASASAGVVALPELSTGTLAARVTVWPPKASVKVTVPVAGPELTGLTAAVNAIVLSDVVAVGDAEARVTVVAIRLTVCERAAEVLSAKKEPGA